MTARHLSHLLLQLFTLAVSYLSKSLLLNMHFHSLPFLVLNLENILLVVFATSSSDKNLVLGLIWLGFVDFGKYKWFSLFFFRVVDWVNHLFRVHRCNINKIGNLTFPQIYFVIPLLHTFIYWRNSKKWLTSVTPNLFKDKVFV